jgi:hypothetical protein
MGAARNSQKIQQAATTVDVDINSSKYKETYKLMWQPNHFDWWRQGKKLID